MSLHYLAILSLGIRSISSKSWACLGSRKRTWYSSILRWTLMTHTAVTCCWLRRYCLSCVWSLASFFLSSSKTVFRHTEHTRQSAFENGRHPLSFHQTCGSHSSPELNAVELTTEFGGKMQQRFYYTKVHDVFKVKQRMPCLVHMQEMSGATSLCVYFAKRRTFKHLIWLKSTRMLTFRFLIFWTLKVNRRYCVNCQIFFCIFDLLYFTK